MSIKNYALCYLNAVFGVDLTTVVKMEGGIVPEILTKCVEELQSRGILLYRAHTNM